MLEALVAFGVVVVVVWLSEEVESRGIRVPLLSRGLAVLVDALWRSWLVLIALTVVAIVVVVVFDLSGVVTLALLAGLVTLVAAASIAGWVLDWRLHALVGRLGFPGRRRARARKIEDAHLRGWHALERRDFHQASSAYQEAADLGDDRAMVNLANILVDELDSPDEAERWYRRAIAAGNTTAAENLALQRLDAGRVEEARELFELARRGGDSAGYQGLADIAVDEGDPQRARALLEIAIIEGDREAYGSLGEVLARMGRHAEAEQRLREGLADGARSVIPVLVDLLRAAGRDDEADSVRTLHSYEEADPWPPQ